MLDPNITLTRIRELVGPDSDPDNRYNTVELMSLVEALDRWATSGGYLPHDWDPGCCGGEPETTEWTLPHTNTE